MKIVRITTADAGKTIKMQYGSNKATWVPTQVSGTFTSGSISVKGSLFTDTVPEAVANDSFGFFLPPGGAAIAAVGYAAAAYPVAVERVAIIVSGTFQGDVTLAVGDAVATGS